MIKRYVRFEVQGIGEGVRAEESGLCDARLDPLQVAIRRNGRLALCDHFTIKKSPAFSVAVDGNRRKNKQDLEGVKLMRAALGLDGWKAQQKVQVFWGGPRRKRREGAKR
ncbi:MAG: hypothetical protein E7316_02355 [Clostridiales bacterium]|nr:hypothetical protein [Clostridiales bacterium]